MPVYDVIVVGAGPGGSNAAAAVLNRGLSVAQIDAGRFPRVKPCAGGLTIKACNSLLLELEPTLKRKFADVQFNAWGHAGLRFRHRSQMMAMVLRPEFDNALVRQNRKHANLAFFDGEPVNEITFDGSLFSVRTAQRRLRARQLIGADGAYSFVNRVFKIAQPKATAVAIEFNVPNALGSARTPGGPCFDFSAVTKGYAWVFPKDDHASVGLYTFARGVKDLRQRLIAYAAAKGFVEEAASELPTQAYNIPVGGYRLEVPDVPVYLVGDAGGFADAITGEGIYHALESGRLAGSAAANALQRGVPVQQYYKDLWTTVLSDTFITYKIAQWFYRNPITGIRILRNPLVWRPYVLGYAEGATVRKVLTHGGLYLARSLWSQLISCTTTRYDGRRDHG